MGVTLMPVTLHGWVKRYYSSIELAVNDGEHLGALAEIKRLKKENARLKLERDILYPLGHRQKATAYFASDTL